MKLKVKELEVGFVTMLTMARVFTGPFGNGPSRGLWRHRPRFERHRPGLGRCTIMILMFLTGFLFKGNTAYANNESLRFSENANLAIRRTAHLLLSSNGDSTTTIPPVKQTDAYTFTIELSHVFKYEDLPELLQKSLDQYGIKRGYHVAVLDCDSGTVQLGYNFLDLKQPEGVPCLTRKEKDGCHILKVVFDPEKQAVKSISDLTQPDEIPSQTEMKAEAYQVPKVVFESEKPKVESGSKWWILPLGGLLLMAGFMFWRRPVKEPAANTKEGSQSQPNRPKLAFGNSELDPANLTLVSSDIVHNLTYREAKLLKLFVSHANQILERDTILKSVWEDEGITVGRSVDVFVSRLRKMLSGDPAIKIAAVHGIGYRMEVAS